MSTIVDRRSDKNLSAGNRKKFKEHYKRQIKDALHDKVRGKSITDSNKNTDIIIDTDIPDKILPPVGKNFHTGKPERVHTGNEEFATGDSYPIPPFGKGMMGSGDDEDSDELLVTLTEEEFIDIYFSDLALPDFVKKSLNSSNKKEMKRAGYKPSGIIPQLDLKKSMRHALARKISAKAVREQEIQDLEYELTLYQDEAERSELRHKIQQLENKHDIYLDEFDLRYRRYEPVPVPECKALIFFIMDVSGSMEEHMIRIARRFFHLMYLFTKSEYNTIEPVFIQYTMDAKIVDEETFFTAHYSGGTNMVAPLDLTIETIKEKYNLDEWNIYIAHACDSESWGFGDNGIDEIHSKVVKELSNYIQYYAYLHINGSPRHAARLDENPIFKMFRRLDRKYDWFGAAVAGNTDDAYQALRKLFEKK